MTKKWHVALGGAALLALAACSSGGDHGMSSTPDAASRMSAGLSDTDKSFITDLSHGSYGEINAAQVATSSSNAAVRNFALRMIKDHSALNNELASLATKKGIEPPTNAGITDSAENAYLHMLPGATFDKQYASQQVSGHEGALQLLKNEAANGQDADLRAFATKYIPAVEQHLQAAKALQANVGAS